MLFFSLNGNTTGVTNGTGTINTSGIPDTTPGF